MNQPRGSFLALLAPRAIKRAKAKPVEPIRGGWEVVEPMFQPLLGDEDPDDCNPWTSDELTVAFLVVGFLVLNVLGVFA